MARAALILAFLSMCLSTVRASSDEACSSDQCNAGNTAGLGLLQTRDHLNKVQEATADEDTNTDLFKMAEKQGPLTAGKFTLQSRPDQEVWVHVPAGDGPFPVLIGLHGSGGLSFWSMDRWSATPGHIVLCPVRNNRDDVAFVHELMDYVSDFTNVVPTGFKVSGFSQGSGITHNVAIQSDDPRITHIITMMAQLSMGQWHDGHFWADGRPAHSIFRRKFIHFTGARDNVIPCCDPNREVFGGYLLHWEDSAYRYAQAMGYQGQKLKGVESEDHFSVSYLNGLVQAFNLKWRGHDMPAQTWGQFASTLLGPAPSSTATAAETAPAPAPAAAAAVPSPAASETAPPAPAPAGAQANQAQGCYAVLYQHPFQWQQQLNGWEATFTPGEYDMQAMEAAGARNDDASAIKVVGEGCSAVLYQHPFQWQQQLNGWEVTFTPGEYDMQAMEAAGARNDDASAIKVISS